MNNPAKKSPNLNESDVISISSDSKCEDDSPLAVNKTRKTYEKRKRISACENNTSFTTSSPISENITSPSPNSLNNTSRYGRARKPKITEDFYNTEDIFGPYDRIPCSPLRSSPKKKLQNKLELSPTKYVDPDEIKIKSIDLTSVLSINIPEDSIEVSKVLKIVTNNSPSEFSPKSPTHFSKPVKTYANRHKKNTDLVYESFGLPDYPAPYLLNSVSMTEDPLAITEDKLVLKEGVNNTLLENPLYIGDDTVFPPEIPKPSTAAFTIKDMSVAEAAPKVISDPKNSATIIKTNKENNKKQRLKHRNKGLPNAQKSSSNNSTASENSKKTFNKHGKHGFKKKYVYKVVGRSRSHKKKIIPTEKQIALPTKIEKPAQINTLLDINAIFRPTVGSICWSRVGTFPFWPSIVSNEPDTDRFHKLMPRGRKMTEFYHVHFFGDNGRRSWVGYSHIFPFHAKTDLEEMAKSVFKEAKPKDPRHISAFIIPSSKLAKWDTAVSEAESIIEYAQEKRMKHFFELVVTKRKQKRNFDSIRSPNSEKPSKKKRLEEGVSPQKLKKKLQKLASSKQVIKGKVESVEGVNDTRRKSLRIIDLSKSCQVSDDSGSESDTTGRKSSNRSVKNDFRDTPSPAQSLSSSLLKKKINLFKGVSRDRVCQLCGEGKNVFKCKGTCFGYYHIECDKRQQNKLKIKVEELEDHSKVEETTAEAIVGEILEDILTSASKAIQKTSALSLAEKIDLKMQEVMENILSEATKYADNTDSCSESDDCCEIVSQTSIIVANLSNLAPESDTNSKKTKSNKRLIKHVTADGVLVIEDDEEDDDKSQEEPSMTKEDLENYKCTFCATNTSPPCFICSEEKTAHGDSFKHKCMTPQCGRFYHGECLKEWPQTKWYISTKSKNINNEDLSCPYHNCHTCISDDPRAPLSRQSNEKLAKCIRCPTTYHINSYCVPAGSQILTAYQIICPKHLGEDENSKQNKMKLMHHVNTSWCFICSMGGSLICCETCPSSFHVECLKLTPPEGRYICEECESGRLPLYDEVVWVKLGSYRWWPAQILFPSLIPEKVSIMSHHKGEFVVRFFGSHDHYWVNRGRVFLFQEGDTGHSSSKKNAVDWLFIKAIKEATVAHKQFMDARQDRVADYHTSMKPPSYVKIKVNKPVGAIKSVDADTSNTTPCDCDPKLDNPCGPDSDCLNRILLTECQPMVCAAGHRCCNQSFQNRRYTPVKPFKTAGKGWGLKTLVPLKKGTFVIEYVGEVINEMEYKRRMKRKHEQKDENYYFLTIDKDRMIDAGPKGNVARFMNHSCSPNCETQKWTVNGDTKVGLFAIKDISQGTELTFNYNLECIGEEKKECRCGAPNCSGFIGAKAKQDELNKKRKSYVKIKKKKAVPEDVKQSVNCFKCGEPDAVEKCDREACNKVYHTSCVSFENNLEGKWFCPWHSCNVCTKRTIRCCFMCTNSYCPLHSEKNIRYDRVKGFICSVHDLRDLDATSNNIDSTDKDTKTKEKNRKSKSKQSRNDPEQGVDEEFDDGQHEEGYNMRRTSGRVSRTGNRISRSSRHSSPVLENTVKRPNGAYNVEIEKGPVRNQNNNLSDKKSTIKKRKSRMSLKKSDDTEQEDLDDIPLEKRLKMSSSMNTKEDFPDLDDSPLLDRLKKNSDMKIQSNKDVQLEDVPLLNRLQIIQITDDHEKEITSSVREDDIPLLQRLRRASSRTDLHINEHSTPDDKTPICLKRINSRTDITKDLVPDNDTSILHRLRRITSRIDLDTNEDSEICNAFMSAPKHANPDYLHERPRSEFRRFTRSLSRTDFISSPATTIDQNSKSDSKMRRSRSDRKTPTKQDRKKRSLSFSHFKYAKEMKETEKLKDLKKDGKKPIGRPRKYSKSPKKVNETPSTEENTIQSDEVSTEIESTSVGLGVVEEKICATPPKEIEISSGKKEPKFSPEKPDEKDIKEQKKLDIFLSKIEESLENPSSNEKTEDKVITTIEESKTNINLESADDLSSVDSKESGKDDGIPEYSHLVTISDNSSEDKFNSSPVEGDTESNKINEAESSDILKVDQVIDLVTETLKSAKKILTRNNLNVTTGEDSSDVLNATEVESSDNLTVDKVLDVVSETLKSPKKRLTRNTLNLTNEDSSDVLNVTEAESSDNLNVVKVADLVNEIKTPKKRLTRNNFNLTTTEDSSVVLNVKEAESSYNLKVDKVVYAVNETLKSLKKRFTRNNLNLSTTNEDSSIVLNVTEAESSDNSKVDKVVDLKPAKKRLTRNNFNSTTDEDLSNVLNKPEETNTKLSIVTTECPEPQIIDEESSLKSPIKSPKKRYTRYNLSLLTNQEESSNSLDSVTEEKNTVTSSEPQIEEKLVFKKCPKKRFTRHNHLDSSNSNSLDMTEDVNSIIKDLTEPQQEETPPEKLNDKSIHNVVEIAKGSSDSSVKSPDNQDTNENVQSIVHTTESTESQMETEEDDLNSSLLKSTKKPFKKFNLSLRKSTSSKEIVSPKLTVKMQKLLNPRPGIRKSSRYLLPVSSTENIIANVSEADSDKDHNALENKTTEALSNSMDNTITSTVDNDSSKPIPFKKKVLKSGIRKSARFSRSDEDETHNTAELHEDDKTEGAIDTSAIFKRKRGRPTKNKGNNLKKLVAPKETIEAPAEVYKMKLTTDSRAKPFDNHVNDVKLTANVPERHLRVILRKTDIESRSDNKFIKMQNDIEKDLPIRKRSKLRYENQLPE